MAYIDYKQAFSSVSHDCQIDTLKTYKICPRMIRFLGHAMSFWGTRIKYFDRVQPRVTRFLRITNGIFQGNSFSAMWFCLALNPLIRTLNKTSYGSTFFTWMTWSCMPAQEQNCTVFLISHCSLPMTSVWNLCWKVSKSTLGEGWGWHAIGTRGWGPHRNDDREGLL